MKIVVERELTTAEAGDIAITAAEGGINYWAAAHSYDSRRWAPDVMVGSIEVPEDFVFYTLTGDTEGEPFNPPIEVTPRLICRGIQRYLSGTPGVIGWPEGRTFNDMDDLAAMDADEADVVIQLGAFGELVYG